MCGHWVLMLNREHNGQLLAGTISDDGAIAWKPQVPGAHQKAAMILGRDISMLQSLAAELAKHKILSPEDGRELSATQKHLEDLRTMNTKLLDASIRRLDRP
jgi:hypothetical protein